MPNDNDPIPEADRQEQLEPVVAPGGEPHVASTRDIEAPEPDLLEQAAPLAATVEDEPPASDDDRLVDLSDEWDGR